jgi:hypothetical protein
MMIQKNDIKIISKKLALCSALVMFIGYVVIDLGILPIFGSSIGSDGLSFVFFVTIYF